MKISTGKFPSPRLDLLVFLPNWIFTQRISVSKIKGTEKKRRMECFMETSQLFFLHSELSDFARLFNKTFLISEHFTVFKAHGGGIVEAE